MSIPRPGASEMDRPRSFVPLSVHNHVDYGCTYRGFADEGTRGRVTGLESRALWDTLALVHESSGCGPCELAGNVDGGGAPAAANGFFQGDSAGIAHAGRDSHNAHERTKHRGPGRGA